MKAFRIVIRKPALLGRDRSSLVSDRDKSIQRA